MPVRVVLLGSDFEQVLAALPQLGAAAPQVVLLTDTQHHEAQTHEGVLAVFPRVVDPARIEALDAAIRASLLIET
jgi:hypothetical protein